MKRFLVFAYSTYYPGGGMNDFEDSFDRYTDALEHCVKVKADNVQIFDMVRQRIIFDGCREVRQRIIFEECREEI